MDDFKHVIAVNGRHYDVRTGKNLSHPWEGPIRRAKPEASHHAPRKPVHQPEPAAAHPKTPPAPTRRRAARAAAGHVAPHRPKPARTLMRQAVKKPAPALKRRIRVQGYLDTQIKPAAVKQTAKRHVRRQTAKGQRVHLIQHFSPNLFTVTTVVTAKPAAPRRLISDRPLVNHDVSPRPTMRSAFEAKPRTTAELLEYAVRYADAPHEAPRKPARKRIRHGVLRRHAHAVAH